MKKNYVTYQIDDFFLFDDEVISYENDATQSDKHLLFRNVPWELIVVIIRLIILSTRQFMFRTCNVLKKSYWYFKVITVRLSCDDDDDDDDDTVDDDHDDNDTDDTNDGYDNHVYTDKDDRLGKYEDIKHSVG
jgi:hypothetical protein